ncbi:MAG: hypothetical protein V7637_3293 [Mycobacteriales bacterium]|jgi:hypothetical protein
MTGDGVSPIRSIAALLGGGSVSDDNLDRSTAVLFATTGFVTVAPDYLGLGTGPGATVRARPH